MERLDSLPEVVRCAQTAVAMPFQLDGGGQEGVVGVIQQLLGSPLGDGRKLSQLLHQGIHSRFKLIVGDDLGRDAPVIRLTPRNTLRAHYDVLCTRHPSSREGDSPVLPDLLNQIPPDE